MKKSGLFSKYMNKYFKIVLIPILLLILVFHFQSFASEALKSEFEQANDFYQKGELEKAKNAYNSILESGVENKSVYYNLGNTYFKLGKLGKAILCYERAQKLAPRDEDIKFNLEFARQKIVDRIELPNQGIVMGVYHSILDFFTINELTILVLIIYFVEMGFILLTIFKKNNNVLKHIDLILGIVLIITIFFFGGKIKSQQIKGGVVLVDKLDVMTEPGTASQIAFTVHEGTKLNIVGKRDEWYRVSYHNKLFGWIKLPQNQKEKIIGII